MHLKGDVGGLFWLLFCMPWNILAPRVVAKNKDTGGFVFYAPFSFVWHWLRMSCLSFFSWARPFILRQGKRFAPTAAYALYFGTSESTQRRKNIKCRRHGRWNNWLNCTYLNLFSIATSTKRCYLWWFSKLQPKTLIFTMFPSCSPNHTFQRNSKKTLVAERFKKYRGRTGAERKCLQKNA